MANCCGREVDLYCILTAVFFFTANLFNIILRASEFQGAKNGDYDYDNFLLLNPQYLVKQWQHRMDHQTLRILAHFFNAMAWFLFCIPVMQLAWVLSRGGKRRLAIHVSMGLVVVAGSLTELISRLMSVGMYGVCMYLAQDFNLNNWVDDTSNDGIGWKALEVASMIADGMLLWIDALEWLALFTVLVLIHVSLKTERADDATLNSSWATLGLVIGILCFFDLAADLLRTINYLTYSTVAIGISTVNTLILLPLWLVWLGVQFQTAKIPYDDPYDELTFPPAQTGHADASDRVAAQVL